MLPHGYYCRTRRSQSRRVRRVRQRRLDVTTTEAEANVRSTRDLQLGITKAGNGYLRLLLVECRHTNVDRGPAWQYSTLRSWGRRDMTCTFRQPERAERQSASLALHDVERWPCQTKSHQRMTPVEATRRVYAATVWRIRRVTCTCCDESSVRMTAHDVRPSTRSAENWQHRLLQRNSNPHRASWPIQSAYRNRVENNMRRNQYERRQRATNTKVLRQRSEKQRPGIRHR